MTHYCIVAASRQVASEQRPIAQESDPTVACAVAVTHSKAYPNEAAFVFQQVTPQTRILVFHTLNP